MLTDVFVNRYEETPIWEEFGERERRFMVQAGKMITEQLFPYWVNGTESKFAKETLVKLHDLLAMELGIDPLSRRTSGTHVYGMDFVLKNFLTKEFEKVLSPDIFIKRRISLVELAFRTKEEAVKAENQQLPKQLSELRANAGLNMLSSSLKFPGLNEEALHLRNKKLNKEFAENVKEINERFRQARFPLVYHNAFIQFSNDPLVAKEIEAPFWTLVSDLKWENVERDILEAIDLRDNSGRDPALYAAKALESTIKIISNEKGWTRGNEGGASAYIDNLLSQNNGRFIQPWEADILKAFFSKVRNPLGHGPGGEPMPLLGPQQDSWAIETCMSWIKSLITRM